jgi:hypothetical protein
LDGCLLAAIMKLSAFVVLGAALCANAAFYERFEDIPIKRWDFIVVGGTLSSSRSRILTHNMSFQVVLAAMS